MDFWRSLQEVLPRFSRPGPGSSQAAPSQVPAAPRQLPGSSQPDPGSSRQLPGRSRQLPEGLPGSSLTVSHSARLSQTSLPGRFPRRSWVPRRSCKASRGSPTTLGEFLAAPRQFPAALRRITYQEWPSRITYQARPSSCLRPLRLFPLGASVELSRHVLSFKTICSNVPPRCSS